MKIKGVLILKNLNKEEDEIVPIVEIDVFNKFFYLINNDILDEFYYLIKHQNLQIETRYDGKYITLNGQYSTDGIFTLLEDKEYSDFINFIETKKLYNSLQSQLEFKDDENKRKSKI